MSKTIKKQHTLYPKTDLKINFTIFFTLLLMICFISGCGGMGSNVRLKFAADLNANNGKPFYIVIRKVTKTNFLVDSYNEVAGMVYSDPQDESLLAWQVMLPGQKKEIKVGKPDNLSIGIYGLFTTPGQNWKVMLNSPLESKYKVDLQNNSLKFNKYGFWRKLF